MSFVNAITADPEACPHCDSKNFTVWDADNSHPTREIPRGIKLEMYCDDCELHLKLFYHLKETVTAAKPFSDKTPDELIDELYTYYEDMVLRMSASDTSLEEIRELAGDVNAEFLKIKKAITAKSKK